MADLATDDTLTEEEREFQEIIAQIGGKERIYLVSDASTSKEVDVDNAEIMQEFIRDMFQDSNLAHLNGLPRSCPSSKDGNAASEKHVSCETDRGKDLPLRPTDVKLVGEDGEKKRRPTHNGIARRTTSTRANIYSLKRTIDSTIIVFIFRQTFISQGLNEVCVKEILKDIKARTKHARIARPALIGLIRTTQKSAQTSQCAQLLDTLVRSVFHKHSRETIWVGSFIPKNEGEMLNIKKNACRVIYASQTAGVITNILIIIWHCKLYLLPAKHNLTHDF